VQESGRFYQLKKLFS